MCSALTGARASYFRSVYYTRYHHDSSHTLCYRVSNSFLFVLILRAWSTPRLQLPSRCATYLGLETKTLDPRQSEAAVAWSRPIEHRDAESAMPSSAVFVTQRVPTLMLLRRRLLGRVVEMPALSNVTRPIQGALQPPAAEASSQCSAERSAFVHAPATIV